MKIKALLFELINSTVADINLSRANSYLVPEGKPTDSDIFTFLIQNTNLYEYSEVISQDSSEIVAQKFINPEYTFIA